MVKGDPHRSRARVAPGTAQSGHYLRDLRLPADDLRQLARNELPCVRAAAASRLDHVTTEVIREP
jgi:hypothetical protein